MRGFQDERPPHRAPGAWCRDGGGRLPLASSLAVAVLQLVGSTVAARHQTTDRVPLDAPGYLLLVLGPALLVFRHRRPVLVAAGTAVVTGSYLLLGYPYGPVFLSLVVAFVAAVGRGHRRAAWLSLAAVYAVHLLITHLLGGRLPGGRAAATWGQELSVAAWMLLVVAVAEVLRYRWERNAERRAAAAEAQRRQVDEERLRIARELHDVLAHSISLIHVQAGVALELMDEQPEQARTALSTIKAASKEALGEVRQVLGTLRTPGAAAPRTPAPGLARLGELADQAARAGLRVTVEEQGRRRELPPGVDLAAFRIVQEALTNVLRHSAARSARVLLRWEPDGLTVRVDDDGPASAAGGAAAGGSGSGLVGMRERAAALGGSAQAGPRGDGGFRVEARLPLAVAGAADDGAEVQA